MALALVVLALVGACRFRFDATDDAARADTVIDAVIDVPLDHDEDGDGFPDVSDVCPHVAGPQDDSDGDRVGDVCDPEPGNPRQQIGFFDPFVNASSWTIANGTWVPQGDALRCDTETLFGELKRPQPFQFGVIELGTDVITRTPASAQHQVTFSWLDTQALPFYYVEAYEAGTSPGYAALSKFDGLTFSPVAPVPMMTGVHTGPLTLRVTTRPAADYLLYVGWPPQEVYTPGGTETSLPARANLHVGAQGVVIDFRYVIVISTN